MKQIALMLVLVLAGCSDGGGALNADAEVPDEGDVDGMWRCVCDYRMDAVTPQGVLTREAGEYDVGAVCTDNATTARDLLTPDDCASFCNCECELESEGC
jgi:hypothetical protein